MTTPTPPKIFSLRAPKAPDLPIAPVEYAQQYQDQLLNALRLYFAQLDNFVQPLASNYGATYVKAPYGAFSSTQTQTAVAAQTPQQVAFNTTDFSSGISVASNVFRVLQSGIYNVAFSVQATNSDTQIHDVDIYFKKNGTPIPNTASVFSVQSTHGGQPGYMVVAANFFIDLLSSDYLEMWWVTNDTNVQLNYLPAITSPFLSPGAPSVVLTFSFVSSS